MIPMPRPSRGWSPVSPTVASAGRRGRRPRSWTEMHTYADRHVDGDPEGRLGVQDRVGRQLRDDHPGIVDQVVGRAHPPQARPRRTPGSRPPPPAPAGRRAGSWPARGRERGTAPAPAPRSAGRTPHGRRPGHRRRPGPPSRRRAGRSRPAGACRSTAPPARWRSPGRRRPTAGSTISPKTRTGAPSVLASRRSWDDRFGEAVRVGTVGGHQAGEGAPGVEHDQVARDRWLVGVQAHGEQRSLDGGPVLGGGDDDGAAALADAVGHEARHRVDDLPIVVVERHRVVVQHQDSPPNFECRQVPVGAQRREPSARSCWQRSGCHAGCSSPASSSIPSTRRVPGLAQAALASTACTGTPTGSTPDATSSSASTEAPSRS